MCNNSYFLGTAAARGHCLWLQLLHSRHSRGPAPSTHARVLQSSHENAAQSREEAEGSDPAQ